MAGRSLGRAPTDLALLSLFILLVNVFVFVPYARDTPLRTVLGLAFVLLVPGYVFTLALFPYTGSEDSNTLSPMSSDRSAYALSAIERGALSVALSISVTPLVGLALNYTPWGVRLTPVMAVLDGLIVLSLIVAAYRGSGDPAGLGIIEMLRASTFDKVLILVSVLTLVGVIGVVVAVPSPASSFSEFYLMTENEQGELVAEDYPEELLVSENETLVFGVQNQENGQVDYTVIIQLQLVERNGDDVQVLVNEELDRFENTVDHNETWRQQHEVSSTLLGDDLKLQYLLYRGEPPANPSSENAYRSVHIWVEIQPSSES